MGIQNYGKSIDMSATFEGLSCSDSNAERIGQAVTTFVQRAEQQGFTFGARNAFFFRISGDKMTCRISAYDDDPFERLRNA